MIQVGFLLLCVTAVTPAPPAPPTIDDVVCINGVAATTNFDITLFAGVWYDVVKFYPIHGREGACEVEKYTLNGDGQLKVEFSWADKERTPHKLAGTIKQSGQAKTDAKLTYTIGSKSIEHTIFYLKSDEYFASYACIEKKAHVWIFARDKDVAFTKLQGTIMTFMQAKYPSLRTTWFEKTSYKDCPAVTWDTK